VAGLIRRRASERAFPVAGRPALWLISARVGTVGFLTTKRRTLVKRVIVIAAVVIFAVSVAYAASVKTYQVTGPVLELKDDMIVVQKGNDKWEIARDKDTKVTGDLKVGSKVTIQYTMSAKEIESKDAPKKEAPAKKEPAKATKK
jgi:hypothetical protein